MAPVIPTDSSVPAASGSLPAPHVSLLELVLSVVLVLALGAAAVRLAAEPADAAPAPTIAHWLD
ncbi:MAG: hypothetical protein CMJ83_21300 [Planctomycetes bacterium]|nr:hypothetical protein [Planctomycetota bacterium]